MGKTKQRTITEVVAGAAPLKVTDVKELAVSRENIAIAVGAELPVIQDYLDMEQAPMDKDRGIAHAGYLVVVKGEVVRALYVGSENAGDAGWMFAEVLRTLRPEPVGRRGWLPERAVVAKAGPQVQAPSTRAAAVAVQGRAQPQRPGPPADPVAGPKPQPQQGPSPRSQGAPLGAALARARGPRTGVSVPLASDEAFPSLVAGRGSVSSSASAPKSWGRGPAGENATPELDEPAKVTAEERLKAIQRHHEAAKKAASGKLVAAVERCPICADAYAQAPGKRRTRRPCCASELCSMCDHKCLRSGKCFFCREVSEEFPSLGLACRVAA